MCPQGFIVLSFASPDPLYNSLPPVYTKLSASNAVDNSARVILVTDPLFTSAAGGNVSISVSKRLAVPGMVAATASSGVTYQWQYLQSFTLVGGRSLVEPHAFSCVTLYALAYNTSR